MTTETEQQILDDLAEIKGILAGRVDCRAMLTWEEVASELRIKSKDHYRSVWHLVETGMLKKVRGLRPMTFLASEVDKFKGIKSGSNW